MAQSPAHKFGQIIGNLLESLLLPKLEEFCSKNSLYLDHHKKRRPARSGKKVTWYDQYGNKHDLDFVIERNGTDEQIGTPVAFIECAWRRYTKHSKNKAQEIQGAILPLLEKHNWNNPFLGVILAGFFTEGSLEQLHSHGFSVLFFPYESLVAAFSSESLDISFDENTPDELFSKAINAINNSPAVMMERIKENLINRNQTIINDFFHKLDNRLGRQIAKVMIIPLYGRVNEFITIKDALLFLDYHSVYEGSGDFQKYEIHVEFSNGDKVDASFKAKDNVKDFLTFVAVQ
jgi:hypothetical protein